MGNGKETKAIVMEQSSAAGALAPTEAGVFSAVAREESEIKASIVSAKHFPRDENAIFSKVIKSCQRLSFAERATYSYPRGSSMITGPSVDLARMMAGYWGNIIYGLRIVTEDRDRIHIKGFAFDLETNTRVEIEDKFQKLIYRKKGGWVEPDERDLRELVNRRGAICLRNAILQLIPSDFTEEATAEAKATVEKAARGKTGKSREDLIRLIALAFSHKGITTKMLTEYIGHDLSLATPSEIAELQGIGKSIADGQTRTEDHFNVAGIKEEPKSGVEKAKARLKAEPDQVDKDTGEVTDSKINASAQALWDYCDQHKPPKEDLDYVLGQSVVVSGPYPNRSPTDISELRPDQAKQVLRELMALENQRAREKTEATA